MVLESPRSSVSQPPTFHPRTRKQNSLGSHQMPLQHTCTGQHETSSRTRIAAFWECRKLLHIQSYSIMVCKITHYACIVFCCSCIGFWYCSDRGANFLGYQQWSTEYQLQTIVCASCIGLHWCWCKVCWSLSFRTQDFSRAPVGTFFFVNTFTSPLPEEIPRSGLHRNSGNTKNILKCLPSRNAC